MDCRYHLQALRHLYVLAVEPRLLLPRDIDTRSVCYAHVTYVYHENTIYRGKSVRLVAPCLLPELNLLKEVSAFCACIWFSVFSKILVRVNGANSKFFANTREYASSASADIFSLSRIGDE